MLRINIIDDGAGLSQPEITKLFTPFERLGKTDSEGTGIGLVICKYFVELMHGEIGLESEKNKGTTFWIELEIA